MKFRWPLLFLFAFLFTSCVIEKRHYRHGFYVGWNNTATGDSQIDSVELESPMTLKVEESSSDASVLVQVEKSTDEVAVTTPTDSEVSTARDESPSENVSLNDEPKPEGHDKINPRVSPMVGVAFALPLSLLVMELMGVVFSNPYVMLIGIPLLAALIFALAMQLRKKYAVLKSIGDKREVLRTSAHFHRFQVMLYIYFAAALMFSLGIALSLSASGILGWIGVVFVGGGMSVGLGAAVILLVLFALYWIRWRKDPTGIKPPRNPHPPKDR